MRRLAFRWQVFAVSVPTTVTDLQRWKRAVVHVEGAADSVPPNEQLAQWREIAERMVDGEFAPDDAPVSRDLRYRGTALFVRDGDAHFLVTARHVVSNRNAAERDYDSSMPDWVKDQESAEGREKWIESWIFRILFRVPNLDDLDHGPEVAGSLMNLHAGPEWSAPYSLSSETDDLAVISLRRDRSFVEHLLRAGHEPIELEALADGPSKEGAEVISVGYPEATAVLGKRPLHPAVAHWASSAVSVPVFSFGRAAMIHDALPFFWADVSIYPGNSGGPVVEDDRLVGIVSAQATVQGVRIPFARVTPAGRLRTLIEEQRAKDRAAEPRTRAEGSINPDQ